MRIQLDHSTACAHRTGLPTRRYRVHFDNLRVSTFEQVTTIQHHIGIPVQASELLRYFSKCDPLAANVKKSKTYGDRESGDERATDTGTNNRQEGWLEFGDENGAMKFKKELLRVFPDAQGVDIVEKGRGQLGEAMETESYCP